MTNKELKEEIKTGFTEIGERLTYEDKEKLEKTFARLYNSEDKENRNWKITEMCGKGFYDSSAEFIIEDKKTGEEWLCRALTNHFGRNGWQSPDLVSIDKIRSDLVVEPKKEEIVISEEVTQ